MRSHVPNEAQTPPARQILDRPSQIRPKEHFVAVVEHPNRKVLHSSGQLPQVLRAVFAKAHPFQSPFKWWARQGPEVGRQLVKAENVSILFPLLLAYRGLWGIVVAVPSVRRGHSIYVFFIKTAAAAFLEIQWYALSSTPGGGLVRVCGISTSTPSLVTFR